MTRSIDILGTILLIIGVGIILLGYVGVVVSDGVGALIDMLSPSNISNWFVSILTLAPGLICKLIAGKMKTR